MRFALLAVPLVGLCASYFRLRHLTGKIMQLPERKLDERQRMIRNRAHRIAYRIITMLCLAILAYICVHSMLLSATPPATTGGVTNALIREFPSKIAHVFTEVTPLKVTLQNSIVYTPNLPIRCFSCAVKVTLQNSTVYWWRVKPELWNTPA